MSSMTKSQLIAALNQSNIALPPSGSRKEEYEKLYNRHIAPKQEPVASCSSSNQGRGNSQPKKPDFSTYSTDEDDDDNLTPVSTPQKHLNGSSSSGGSTTISPMGLNQATKLVNNLSDKDLYDMLVELDYKDKIGPVIPTTRAIYRQMLKTILMGETPFSEPNSPASSNGEGTPDRAKIPMEEDFGNEFSDSDREPESSSDRNRHHRGQFEEAYMSLNETTDSSFQDADSVVKRLGPGVAKQRAQGLTKRLIRDVSGEREPSTPTRRTPVPSAKVSSKTESEAGPSFKPKTPRKVDPTKTSSTNGVQFDTGRKRAPGISPWVIFVVLLMVSVGLLYVYKNFLEGGEPDTEMDDVDREIEEILNQQ